MDSYQALRSSGIAFLGCEAAPHKNGPATIVVVGVSRSGTSMVASCLRELGVYIGADNAVHEDLEVASALEGDDLEKLTSLVEARNSSYDIWGFKRPMAFRIIDKYICVFRNPRFVITFRDPVAIAKRNEISMHSDFLYALRNAATLMVELVSFVSTLKHPAMLISYEKALLDPWKFTAHLATFCCIDATSDAIEKAAATIENGPVRYLDNSRLRFEGCLDQVVNGVAFGWARQVGRDSPQMIVIKRGERLIGRGKADLFRLDLKKAGKGTGHCAFEIKLNDQCVRIDDVTAHVAGTTFALRKPMRRSN